MKNGLAILLMMGFGLIFAGCGDKAPKITWKETTGTVVTSTDRGDGSCVTEIEYDTGKGKSVTTTTGSKVVEKGKTVTLKYDEANPGSIKSIEGL